jgi:Zn-finger nucleic acid-binding protein
MNYELFVNALLIFGVVIAAGSYAYRRKGLRPSFRDSPVLLVQSTQGELINGHQGNTPAGLPYTYLLGSLNLFSNDSSIGVFAVYLPFQTKAHLVGLPRGGDKIQLRSFNSAMEPVELEGDYPQYFQLFADRGQQADSRYILDPKAMVFTIDFCKDAYWEIANNTLYFFSDTQLPSFEILDQFVEEIRPAVEVSTPKDHSRIAYGHTQMTTLLCPICDTQLVDGDAWLECPQQHGLLITGRQMRDYREKMIPVDDRVAYRDGRTEKLKCPYCAQSMIPSRFQNTDITIDRCSKCIYRWIDTPEVAGILGIGLTKPS